VQIGSVVNGVVHGNTIAFNHGNGVTSAAQSVDIVNVRGNSIFSNVGLGIHVHPDQRLVQRHRPSHRQHRRRRHPDGDSGGLGIGRAWRHHRVLGVRDRHRILTDDDLR
jgi:hypothetical protein